MESSFSGIGVCPRWKGRLAAWHEVTPRNTRRQNTSTLEALANARPKQSQTPRWPVGGGASGVRGGRGGTPLCLGKREHDHDQAANNNPLFQTCFCSTSCSGRREAWGWRLCLCAVSAFKVLAF